MSAASPSPLVHRFHLAFPVRDLEATRAFYGGLLGCREGRIDEPPNRRWVDFDFFGHQITAHVAEGEAGAPTNPVDGELVPVRHFGVILDMAGFDALRDKLVAAKVPFRIEPQIRFAGMVGEQATMFIDDPSGNVLEFKAFGDPSRIFAREG